MISASTCFIAAKTFLMLLEHRRAYTVPQFNSHSLKNNSPSSVGFRDLHSHLNLFSSIFQIQNNNSDDETNKIFHKKGSTSHSPLSQKYRIPEREFHILMNGFGLGKVPLYPYLIDLLPPNTNKASDNYSDHATELVIRHLEVNDIVQILPELMSEFGSFSSSSHSLTHQTSDDITKILEKYLFSLTVLIGLTQRVERRKKGYPDEVHGANSKYPDHNVVCLLERTPNNNHKSEGAPSFSEEIVGIGELSWQLPDPNRNAPPFVVPFFIKSFLAKFFRVEEEETVILNKHRRNHAERNTLHGYISNVLVWKKSRGQGYGSVIMASLEGIARMWGCSDIRLHVDANENTGKAAQILYHKLGYQCVPERRSNESNIGRNNVMPFEWMGQSVVNNGLYMVDGVPLLYLRKKLTDV